MSRESAGGVTNADSCCRTFSSQEFHVFREVSIGRGATCEVYVGQLLSPSLIGAAQVAPVVLSDAAAESFLSAKSKSSNQTELNGTLTPMPITPVVGSTLQFPLVAVKYVSKSESSHPDDPFALPTKDVRTAIKRLTHEQRILSQLDHPGVCKLFGNFSDDTCAISVQRLYPCGSLASHLRAHARRLMPLSIVREYMREMVLILHYLHSTPQVAHRDISAKNFVIDKQGHLVLIDFGMAHVESSSSSSSNISSSDVSSSIGASLIMMLDKQDGEGSLYYLAPERLGFNCSSPSLLPTSTSASSIPGPRPFAPSSSSSSSDFASDWWALGVIFHEMLFGFLPFDGHNDSEIRDAIRQYSDAPCKDGTASQSSSDAAASTTSEKCNDYNVSLLQQLRGGLLLPQSTLERLDGGGPIAVRGTDDNLSLLSHLLHSNPTLRWGDSQISQIQSHAFFADLKSQWPQTQQQAIAHWVSSVAIPCATNLGAFASLECAKEFEAVDSKSLKLA